MGKALDFLLPWDSQPQKEVEIDQRWISRGLVTLLDSSGRNALPSLTLSNVGTFTHRATNKGVGDSNGGTTYKSGVGTHRNIIAPTNTQFTVVGIFALNATGLSNTYLAMFRDGGASQAAILYGYAANSIEFYAPASTGTDPRTGSALVVSDTNAHTFCYAYDGTTWSGALDGTQVFSTARTFALNVGASINGSFLYSANGGAAVTNATILGWAVFNTGLSRADQIELTANPWQLFAPRSIQVPVSAGGGDPTAALANNLATTASGILVPALALATTGNIATASQGTATPALSLATTGNAATASTGTPVASISLALTGNGATSSVGTVGVGGTTQALTGNEATTSAGTPVAQISLALTGNASTASVGTVVPALSKALTGNAATTSAGTPTAALSLALAGNGATASAGTVAVPGVIVPSSNVATASSGTVSPGITVALTGNGVTASVGTVSKAISLALSGLAGTSSAGIVVPGLTKALTGNTATSAAGSVSVPTGDITLALSGNAATAAVGTLGVDQGANSAWWTYTVEADNLTFTIAADDLTYSIDATTLAGAST